MREYLNATEKMFTSGDSSSDINSFFLSFGNITNILKIEISMTFLYETLQVYSSLFPLHRQQISEYPLKTMKEIDFQGLLDYLEKRQLPKFIWGSRECNTHKQ